MQLSFLLSLELVLMRLHDDVPCFGSYHKRDSSCLNVINACVIIITVYLAELR